MLSVGIRGNTLGYVSRYARCSLWQVIAGVCECVREKERVGGAGARSSIGVYVCVAGSLRYAVMPRTGHRQCKQQIML